MQKGKGLRPSCDFVCHIVWRALQRIPPSFSQKWWFHVDILFVCVRMGHRYMTNPKIGQGLTRVGLVGPEVGVLRYKSVIFLRDSLVCEASATSKLHILFSSLHHPYIPMLGYDAKWEEFTTLPRTISCVHCPKGSPTYTS